MNKSTSKPTVSKSTRLICLKTVQSQTLIMSGLVNPGSNPYLQNPEFLQQLQNQYYQNSSQLVNQTPLNFYPVNQIMQPSYFVYQSQNFQLPMQTSFHQSNFQQPPAQTYYQTQEDTNSPWASNGFQCQQGVSSPTQSVSSSIVQLDQSLLSPSLQDTSGFSNQSSNMSPHSLQYQWEGLNTQRASSTYPEPSKTLSVQHTQLQIDDMLCKSPISSSQAERYVVREVKYSMTDDCPDQQLVIQLDEKPDTNPEEEQNSISNNQLGKWKDVFQTVGLDFQELPDIKDEDLNLTFPLPEDPLSINNGSYSSADPNKASSISTSNDVFEDDFDEDFDRGMAFPAGSAEQTRALGSSQFMKKMRKYVEHLKATRGHLLTLPVVKQETEMPETRKMAQPKRRELKRDLNQGVVPGIFSFNFLLVEQPKYEIIVFNFNQIVSVSTLSFFRLFISLEHYSENILKKWGS